MHNVRSLHHLLAHHTKLGKGLHSRAQRARYMSMACSATQYRKNIRISTVLNPTEQARYDIGDDNQKMNENDNEKENLQSIKGHIEEIMDQNDVPVVAGSSVGDITDLYYFVPIVTV